MGPLAACAGMAYALLAELCSKALQVISSYCFLSLISIRLAEHVNELAAGSIGLLNSSWLRISPLEEFSRTMLSSVKLTERPSARLAPPIFDLYATKTCVMF